MAAPIRGMLGFHRRRAPGGMATGKHPSVSTRKPLGEIIYTIIIACYGWIGGAVHHLREGQFRQAEASLGSRSGVRLHPHIFPRCVAKRR